MKAFWFAFMLLFAAEAAAKDADLSWTNATQNTDGSAISQAGNGALVNTIVEYGTCSGVAFGAKQGEITVAFPGNTVKVNMVVVQSYCFRAYHTNVAGEKSGYSNVATAPNNPVPGAPGGLKVTSPTAYNVLKVPDGFLLVAVGTVAPNTACKANQSVNGMNVVPREAVTKNPGVDIELVVVVAQCG